MPKPLTDTSRRTLCAYLPADLARRAREHARATDRSLSSLVIESLRLYFATMDAYLDAYEAVSRIAQQDAEAEWFDDPAEHEAALQHLTAISTAQAQAAQEAQAAQQGGQ